MTKAYGVGRFFVAVLFVLGSGLGSAALAQQTRTPERWIVPSLDAPHGERLGLSAWWFPALSEDSARRKPTVLMLHGCGGMLDRSGRKPSSRTLDYAQWLNAQGWHALALDSLSARDERELCTQKTGGRRVTQFHRRLDVMGALQHLSEHPEVDPHRVVLLGWSHGGSTVLAATNRRHADVARAPLTPRLAVAFYPGCGSERQRGYQPNTDVLLLLGLADDWTPAAPCQDLQGPRVQVHAWEGAHHSFDGTAPVRLRADVPNGVNPGQGVHVGGHPEARAAARGLLSQALARVASEP